MDVQFKAQEFKLAVLGVPVLAVDNDPVLSVKLPFKSKGYSFSILTKLNPGPANVTLSLNNEEYRISQDKQQIFVKSWNQNIFCQNLFEESDCQQTITFTIPKVTRETRASASIGFKNKIDRSYFNFTISVACPEEETGFCENGGRCEENEKDVSCNCDGTGFYGDICKDKEFEIELTSSNDLCGRYYDPTDRLIHLPYMAKNHSFTLQAFVNAKPTNVTLFMDDEAHQLSEEAGQIFIKSWKHSITYECTFDGTTSIHKTVIRIPEVTQKTLGKGKLAFGNEEGWSSFDFSVTAVPISDFCNMRAGCCKHGVIFNSRTPATNRSSHLSSSVSRSLGVYFRKQPDSKATNSAKRAEYQKLNQHSMTPYTLDWAPAQQSWVVLKYGDDTKNENLWKGPRLGDKLCVNQKYFFDWKFASGNNEYESYEISTQCLDSNVFWESESEDIDKHFQREIPPTDKKRTTCKDEDDFACDNGEQCISSLHMWDGIFDCSDRSDEGPDKSLVLDVSIGKEIFIDKQKDRLGINVSISVTLPEAMTQTGQGVIGYSIGQGVVGYSISIEPTMQTEDKNTSTISCSRSSCKVHRDEFKFDENEEYKITVIPVTRSTLKRHPNLDVNEIKVKATSSTDMGTFHCKKNGILIEIQRSQLCNSEKDCDEDGDKVGIDERPEICRGRVAKQVQLGIFSYALIVMFILLVAISCKYNRRAEQHGCEAEEIKSFRDSVNNLTESPSILSRLSELHDSRSSVYYLLIDFLMFASQSLREEAAVVIMTNKVEAEKHGEDPAQVYDCMKSEGVVMQKLLVGLENYRGNGTPDPSIGASSSEDEIFGFLLGKFRKYRRKVNRGWKKWFCTVQKKPVGFVLTTLSVWTGVSLLGLQFVDNFKDAGFVAILNHYDKKIIEEDYEKAFITHHFYIDIHAMVIVSLSWIVASHLFSLVYIVLSCRTFKIKFDQSCFCLKFETEKVDSFLQRYPHLYCKKSSDGNCLEHSWWRWFYYFLFALPMAPQIILYYEASIRNWRCYKSKEAKREKSMRSFIKYNRAMKDLEEIEKINKDLKLIENVVEAYGQMIFQLIVLKRLKTLLADNFHFMGLLVVDFKYYMWITLTISFLGLLSTIRGYKIRGKEHFRPSLFDIKFLAFNIPQQLFLPLMLITTKIFIYFVCFANQPHWIFVGLLAKFVASLVLNSFLSGPYSNFSPQDKLVHSLVCVILPLSAPPAYKDSFFARPRFAEGQVARTTKEEKTVEKNQKRETGYHLLLYILECMCIIAYATTVYLCINFKDKPYADAFQKFWNELARNWSVFPPFLGLFTTGIIFAILVLVLVLVCYGFRCKHPRWHKFKLLDSEEESCCALFCWRSCCQRKVNKKSDSPEKRCCSSFWALISSRTCCKGKVKEKLDFDEEKEIHQMIEREVDHEDLYAELNPRKFGKKEIGKGIETMEIEPLMPRTLKLDKANMPRGYNRRLIPAGNVPRHKQNYKDHRLSCEF